MPIFKTGLPRGKHCRNVSYHRLNKHIALAAVNYFICLPAWDTLPDSAQDKVSSVCAITGSRCVSSLRVPGWGNNCSQELTAHWVMLIAWQMKRELWRSRNEQVKALWSSWAMYPCPGSQTLGEREMAFELYAIVTEQHWIFGSCWGPYCPSFADCSAMGGYSPFCYPLGPLDYI